MASVSDAPELTAAAIVSTLSRTAGELRPASLASALRISMPDSSENPSRRKNSASCFVEIREEKNIFDFHFNLVRWFQHSGLAECKTVSPAPARTSRGKTFGLNRLAFECQPPGEKADCD